MKMYYNHLTDKMEKLEPEFMALNLPKSKEEYETRVKARESLRDFCRDKTQRIMTPEECFKVEEVLPVVGDEVVETNHIFPREKLQEHLDYLKTNPSEQKEFEMGIHYKGIPGYRYCSEAKDTPEIAPVQDDVFVMIDFGKDTIKTMDGIEWKQGDKLSDLARELEEKERQPRPAITIFEEVSGWINPDVLEGNSMMRGGATTYSQKNFDYGHAATEVEAHCPCDECDETCGKSDDEMELIDAYNIKKTSTFILSVIALIVFAVLAWILIHIK